MEGAQRVVLLQLWSLSLAGPSRAADPQRTLLRRCGRRGHAALAGLGARPGHAGAAAVARSAAEGQGGVAEVSAGPALHRGPPLRTAAWPYRAWPSRRSLTSGCVCDRPSLPPSSLRYPLAPTCSE